MNEQQEFKNLIGGKHTINQRIWALSLVRKFDADHAYLIMEGIGDDNQRIVMDAHLVVKKGSNDKKGDIVYRDISDRLEELQKIGISCSSYTWNISRFQVNTFDSLIQSEQQRAKENKINYVQFGQAKITGVFVSLADDEKASLGDNPLIDALTRDGHNCGSWAVAMVRALQLPFKGNYMPFFFNRPKDYLLPKEQKTGDKKPEPITTEPEPTTEEQSICLTM